MDFANFTLALYNPVMHPCTEGGYTAVRAVDILWAENQRGKALHQLCERFAVAPEKTPSRKNHRKVARVLTIEPHQSLRLFSMNWDQRWKAREVARARNPNRSEWCRIIGDQIQSIVPLGKGCVVYEGCNHGFE